MPQTQPALTPKFGIKLLELNSTGQSPRVNEAINVYEVLAQASVKDKDLATPPGSPTNGDAYIVAASPTGAWSGKAKYIAAWYNSAWLLVAPTKGMLVHVDDEDKFYKYDGSAWAEYTLTVTTAPTRTTVTKTASFTASTSEAAIYRIDASSGNVTVTLPAASGVADRGWVFKRIDASLNTVVIDPNGAEAIDGQPTWSLIMQYDDIDINSNGTDWDVV